MRSVIRAAVTSRRPAGKQTEARFGFMFKDPPSYGPPDELL
jgi:hypothetical protein